MCRKGKGKLQHVESLLDIAKLLCSTGHAITSYTWTRQSVILSVGGRSVSDNTGSEVAKKIHFSVHQRSIGVCNSLVSPIQYRIGLILHTYYYIVFVHIDNVVYCVGLCTYDIILYIIIFMVYSDD